MKRIVPLLVLVVALAVPVAAYADDPPSRPSTPSAQSGGNGGGPAARLRHTKRRLRMQLRHCKKAQGAERQACLHRIIERLEQLKARIDQLEAKIKEKCPGATPAADPSVAPARVAGDKCSRAPRLLARLERMKARIDKLEARIREYLSGDSPDSDAASSDGSSADADSIASLEAQLAAVAAQQG